MKDDTAPKLMTASQLGDLVRAFPKRVPSELVQIWIGQKRIFEQVMERVLYDLVMDPDKLVNAWNKFYREICNKVCSTRFDFSNIQIPTEKFGFGWIIPVAKGITAEKVYQVCQSLFSCQNYSLDQATIRNDREPSQDYVIRILNRKEADQELSCLSADDLERDKIQAITLFERGLLEAWYYFLTKCHLDEESNTLCAGSRRSDDDVVPGMSWRSGRLRVCWYDSDTDHPRLRARAVVSL